MNESDKKTKKNILLNIISYFKENGYNFDSQSFDDESDSCLLNNQLLLQVVIVADKHVLVIAVQEDVLYSFDILLSLAFEQDRLSKEFRQQLQQYIIKHLQPKTTASAHEPVIASGIPSAHALNSLEITPPSNQKHEIPIYSIGHSDLDPFASSGSSNHPHSGMIMDQSHPLFNTPIPHQPIPQNPNMFPSAAVPPGVRFDPIMPFGSHGPRFPVRPSRGNYPGRNPLSGDPDNDELLPPGGPGDMYF